MCNRKTPHLSVRRFGKILALLPGLVLASCDQSTLGPEGPDAPTGTPQGGPGTQELIITVEPGTSPAAVANAHGLGADRVFSHVLNGFVGTVSEAARAGLLKDARIVRMEENATITTQQDPGALSWGLDRIDQRPTELDGAYRYDGVGDGVTVYVVDTGIQVGHPEFGGRATHGYPGDAEDCHGHGTHVAGTIGGTTYGVAKGVDLVAVKVLDCAGTGTWADMIAGLEWVAANGVRPAVINMSLGGAFSETANEAVARLTDLGFPVVVAAGNSNADACGTSPASAPSAITVAATASNDLRAGFSNYGPCVDWFAPGARIESAWLDGTTRELSGTSMASPHTAGVAALLLGTNGALSAGEVTDSLSAYLSLNRVMDAMGAPPHVIYSGRGVDTDAPGAPPVFGEIPAPTITAVSSTERAEITVYAHDIDERWTHLEFEIQGGDYVRYIPRGGSGAVANPQTSHTFTSDYLDGSTTYRVRVRTQVDNGFGKYSSDWSEVLEVTTCDARGSGECRSGGGGTGGSDKGGKGKGKGGVN